MKRNNELVRQILELAEAEGHIAPIETYAIKDFTEEEIEHHIFLMYKEGLVVAEESTQFNDDLPMAKLRYLTWKGHDLLEYMRHQATETNAFLDSL